MPDIYGPLAKAQLEEIASASPTPAARSRIYSNKTDTTNCIPMFHDGSYWVALSKRRETTRTVSTTDAVVASDYILYANAAGAAFTVALPAAATVPGMVFRIWKTDSTLNAVTIDPSGAELINGVATVKLNTLDEWVDVISTGTAWQIIGHDFFRGKTAYTPVTTWIAGVGTIVGYWWRVANRINLEILVPVTGAVTAASLTCNLPVGVTIDTSTMAKVEAAVSAWPGVVKVRDASPAELYSGMVLYSTTTAIAIFKDDGDGTQSVVNATAPITFAVNDYVHIFANDMPVVNWLAA